MRGGGETNKVGGTFSVRVNVKLSDWERRDFRGGPGSVE